MIQFISNQPSLFLLLISAILTGAMAEPSFASLIVHIINLGLLLAIRIEAKRNYPAASIFILLSVGLTAVMTREQLITIIFQAINFGILILIAVFSSLEARRVR